ncbi:serine/threonine-protein kinase meng-po-like [Culicoides brevitarsis]|uniref:serine/threonine-protein kinase meng-po-like n=1 Tax=Culicoides brevitarsis TaxID=469753 RepID=UPI00307CC620
MTFLYKTLNKKIVAANCVYQRVPDVEIPHVLNLEDDYFVEKCLAEGFYAKIYLARHKDTKTQVVLKACHSEVVNLREFAREFHYSYQLSHHPNILNCYNVAFQTDDYYIFAQEYTPYSDLAIFVGPFGLPESCCKKIAEQLSNALAFMHSKKLVHRDIKLENVLVFALDFSRVKLCDFGATTRDGLLVRKTNNTWTSFLSPEVLEVIKNERFHCRTSQDVWSFGVLIFLILTGTTPWERADWVRDAKYCNFMKYQKRETQKIPENFRRFTPRILRAFRRMFDHDERDRAKASDIMKYMKDKWLDSKSSNAKFSFSSQIPSSDKDSIVMNLSTTNKLTKTATMLSHNPEERVQRTRRIMSCGVLPLHDISEPVVDPNVRITAWLKECAADPDPLEEQAELEMPSIIVTTTDVQRPLTWEQWCIMNNISMDNKDNKSMTGVNISRKSSIK